MLNRLFEKKPELKQEETNQLTPTIRYFLEKNKGNAKLDNYERNAIAYIKTIEPTTPPDLYFAQKLSNAQGGGIIPSNMGSRLLDHYEEEAIEYVKQFYSSQTFTL